MAEVSGLVLGAIVLASLFNTCVELFECVQLGKSADKDYELAVTKILLLKTRLSCWGDALNVKQSGSESPALRQTWSQEQDIIRRSLFGIKAIFDDTFTLTGKYKALPRRSVTLSSVSLTRRGCTDGQGLADPNHSNASTGLSLFCKRTVWAVHDKNRLDRLIADLSFLIENLEIVANRVCAGYPVQQHQITLTPVVKTSIAQGPTIGDALVSSQDSGVDRYEVPAVSAPQYQAEHLWRPRSSMFGYRKSHVVSRYQQKSGCAKGVQGVVGHGTEVCVVKGTQVNTTFAFGVQGVVTTETALKMQEHSADVVSKRTKIQ